MAKKITKRGFSAS